MMDQEARIRALEGEIDRLREQVRALEAALGAEFEPSVVLGLTPHEARLIGVLVKRGQATKDQLMHALYALRMDGDEPEIKIVDVYVCKVRKKLAPYGITIGTIWGQGYSMSSESRARVCQLTEQAA